MVVVRYLDSVYCMMLYFVLKYEVIEFSDGKKIDIFNVDILVSNVSVRICGGVVLLKR